ncbi:Amidohydrolase [Pleurostoma richardsiae]|uniref:Amidohydrolase n=1 Tax=Pleurostoma richardsiae TaxID=41990 RepID=A0AA38S593_9PEZI|nr:Amidohydrolase [Pleurostoma richardsiae]
MTPEDLQKFTKPWLPATQAPSWVLENAKIVDPVEGKILEPASIHIANGIIVDVAVGLEQLQIPPGSQRFDLKGRYICPGLIDCHVHINAVPGDLDLRQTMATPDDLVKFRMVYVCRDMLYRGFTTVRDCGGAPLALKEACAEWLIPGPRLHIAGHALSQTGGHGDFRSAHDHKDCAAGFVNGLGRVADGVPECLRAARDEIRCGADFLKIMGGGGIASPTDKLEHQQYSPEEIQAYVSVARNVGTYVTCHAYTPEAITRAVSNGVMGIEHGNLIDRRTARLMAEKGAFLTPTLIALRAMADKSLFDFLPPANQEKNKKVIQAGLNALKLAHEEGVTLCYGSDLLGPLGQYQAQEFEIRSQVLPAVEILRSATINPARMMGLHDLGQIKSGFQADMIIVNSNPLEDIKVLARPETEVTAVFREGRLCRDDSKMFGGGLLDKWAKL